MLSWDRARSNFWAIRTRNDPTNYANAVGAAVREVDSQVVVNEIQTGDALMEKAQSGTRFSLLLIGVFATIAGVLAGVGLYGVLATTVRHRTAEIGVRMALGAEPARVFQLGGRAGIPSERDWSGVWPDRSIWTDTTDEGDAGRCAGDRSRDLRMQWCCCSC